MTEIPVEIVTTTTLRIRLTTMVNALRQGGLQLPEPGRVRLTSTIDDDDIGDQIVTLAWTEDRK